MDSLELVLSNDDVAQGCAVLQDEHGVVTTYIQLALSVRISFSTWTHTSVIITVAGTTTVVLAVGQVNIARDLTGRRQRDNITHARGDVESLGTGNANETEEDSAGVHFV